MNGLGPLVQILTALGIGGVIGKYLESSVQRRQTRADLLRALVTCEQSRWIPLEEGEEPWPLATRELRARALVAGVPPRAVNASLIVAEAARAESQSNWDRYGAEEVGGFISNEMGALVEDAARLVTDLAWSPHRHRPFVGRRITKLQRQAHAIDSAREIDWTRTPR